MHFELECKQIGNSCVNTNEIEFSLCIQGEGKRLEIAGKIGEREIANFISKPDSKSGGQKDKKFNLKQGQSPFLLKYKWNKKFCLYN